MDAEQGMLPPLEDTTIEREKPVATTKKWKDSILKRLVRKPTEGEAAIYVEEVITVTLTGADGEEPELEVGELANRKKPDTTNGSGPLIDQVTNAWMEDDDMMPPRVGDESRTSLSTKGSRTFVIRSRVSTMENTTSDSRPSTPHHHGLNAERLTSKLKEVMRNATRRMAGSPGPASGSEESEGPEQTDRLLQSSEDIADVAAAAPEKADQEPLAPTPDEPKTSSSMDTVSVIELEHDFTPGMWRPSGAVYNIKRKPVGGPDSQSTAAQSAPAQQPRPGMETASTTTSVPTVSEPDSAASEADALPVLELEATEMSPDKIALLQAKAPKSPPPEPPAVEVPSSASTSTDPSSGSESDSGSSSNSSNGDDSGGDAREGSGRTGRRKSRDILVAVRLAESMRVHPPPHASSAPVLPEIRRLSLIEETQITTPQSAEFPSEFEAAFEEAIGGGSNSMEKCDATTTEKVVEKKSARGGGSHDEPPPTEAANEEQATSTDASPKPAEQKCRQTTGSTVSVMTGQAASREDARPLPVPRRSSRRVTRRPAAPARTRAEQERELSELETRRRQLEARRETLLQLKMIQEEEDRVNERIGVLKRDLDTPAFR